MNQLKFDTGGRPIANDDFLTLQTRDALLGLPALLLGLAPCIVSGCRVYQTGSVWNVAPGMVWDGVNLLDFTGRSNVSLPAMFAPGATTAVEERAYQTGGTKTTIEAQYMNLVPVVAGAPNLVVDTYGALTFWHRTQERTRSADQVEWLASLTSAHYDADGVGKPGTEAWGWALCNGQGGRLDLGGRVAVGQDAGRSDYDTVGKAGGQERVVLTTAQLPPHSHSLPPNVDTNAGGGTGLTRSGNQGATGNYGLRTGEAGSGQAHENRMPYAVLVARQWVGY